MILSNGRYFVPANVGEMVYWISLPCPTVTRQLSVINFDKTLFNVA